MATVFKGFNTTTDIVNSRTLLHEYIPVTGSILSGTYSEQNIKYYSHGKFQSVYDYPYLSSSANHILDITAGFSSDSSLSGATSQHLEVPSKIQMYNQMAQVLMGYDVTGSILKFDRDGDLLGSTEDKMKECVFLSFSRLLAKDEIKKGDVVLTIGTGSYSNPFDGTKVLQDWNADSEYRVNSPAGEYGILYTGSAAVEGTGVGLVFYQAGLMVITASVFGGDTQFLLNGTTDQSVSEALSGSSIDDFGDAVRSRIQSVNFKNTVELNSKIYFCRIDAGDFNYSSNPTYLNQGKIIVKDNMEENPPISYITTVGLYSAQNELLAVAKLSEPLKKTGDNALILRTRLDF